MKNLLITKAIAMLLAMSSVSRADTIEFSGYTWEVRSGMGGPGPNHWSPKNVWLDKDGHLHMKLSQREGVWYGSEVYTQQRLGIGTYQFAVIGRVDQLDHNVVFGLFNYPTQDVGPNETHEIDIEYAKWGRPELPIGNYSVWPAATGVKYTTKPFTLKLDGDWTTQRFHWTPTSIFFQSLHGHQDDNANEYASWKYEPKEPTVHIAQKPMRLHINLWGFEGRAPSDGKDVELVIRSFKFTPYAAPKAAKP